MNTNYQVIYFVKKYCSSQWRLSDDQIFFSDLTFVLDGEAQYISEGVTLTVHAGEAVFLPGNCSRYAQTKGMECIAFNFTFEQNPLFDVPKLLNWNGDSNLTNHFLEYEKSWLSNTEISKIKCQGIFLLIISRILELQQLQSENVHIAAMKSYLLTHYMENITVHSLASHLNLSPVYCGALFSKETGETILSFTNRVRITKAISLLKYGNTSIGEIAFEVGFHELYYFSRVFKSYTGYSPEQYRKNA